MVLVVEGRVVPLVLHVILSQRKTCSPREAHIGLRWGVLNWGPARHPLMYEYKGFCITANQCVGTSHREDSCKHQSDRRGLREITGFQASARGFSLSFATWD